MNTCVFTGRIGSDINVKKTNNGKSVLQINLAVKRTKEITDWIPVVLWNQSADFIGQYAQKGDLIEVSGALQSRQYESNGQKRTVYEVHATNTAILSHSEKRNASNEGNPTGYGNSRQNGGNEASEPSYGFPTDEDLPF